jgi:thiamine-phosphate pyrophosphorylase
VPQLYLMTPPIKDAGVFAGQVPELLAAREVAALLARWALTDPAEIAAGLTTLAPIVQSQGVALLADGLPEIAVRSGADGAHLTDLEGLKPALAILKPQHIAGAGGLKTRDAAMLAAEAGADYVMFGEPDAAGWRPSFGAVLERVAWWAEIFEPPCAGFAASLDEVAALASAGADFVVAGDLVFNHPRGAAAGLMAVHAQLRL